LGNALDSACRLLNVPRCIKQRELTFFADFAEFVFVRLHAQQESAFARRDSAAEVPQFVLAC
jgi:hypothetical protein